MPYITISADHNYVREEYNKKRADGSFSSHINIDRLPSGSTIISGSDVDELIELEMNF